MAILCADILQTASFYAHVAQCNIYTHTHIFNMLIIPQQLCSQTYHTSWTNRLYIQFATLITTVHRRKKVMRLKYRAMSLLIIFFKTVPNGLNTYITAFIQTLGTLGKLIFGYRFFWISMGVSKWLVHRDDSFQKVRLTISSLHKISAGNQLSEFCLNQANWGKLFSRPSLW